MLKLGTWVRSYLPVGSASHIHLTRRRLILATFQGDEPPEPSRAKAPARATPFRSFQLPEGTCTCTLGSSLPRTANWVPYKVFTGSQSGARKSEIKVSLPSEAVRTICPMPLPQLLALAGNPWGSLACSCVAPISALIFRWPSP